MNILNVYPVPGESPRTRTFYTIAAVIVALAMFAAALGSGNPDTPLEAKPPAWVDNVGNILAAGIGVLALVPRTRAVAGSAAVVIMVVSMYLNYTVDGVEFFLLALPFNLVTLTLGALMAWYYGRARAPAR
ncbi:MAG: hypothetical protein AAF602_20600 [Myxococcota bacterium]